MDLWTICKLLSAICSSLFHFGSLSSTTKCVLVAQYYQKNFIEFLLNFEKKYAQNDIFLLVHFTLRALIYTHAVDARDELWVRLTYILYVNI